jgi:hypothetical protein
MTRRCPAAAAMSEGAKNKDDCKLVLLGQLDVKTMRFRCGKLDDSCKNCTGVCETKKKKKEKKRKESG